MTERFFRYRGVGPEGTAGDYWSLIRLMLSGGDLGRVALLRFEGLRHGLGDKWPQAEPAFRRIVRAEAAARLGGGGSLVPFDDVSLLLILGGQFAGTARAAALAMGDAVSAGMRGLTAEAPFEVWDVAGVAEDGLSCRDDTAPPAAVPLAPLVLGDAEFVFHPVWDVRRGSVFAYRCQPSWSIGGAAGADEEDMASQFRNPARLAALDLETLHKGLEKLEEALDRDSMANVILPLHFDTLTSPESWSRYAGGMAEAGPLPLDRVHLEIVHVPARLDGGRLADALRPAMVFRRGVSMRVGFDFAAFGEAAKAGLHSVGIDLTHDRRDESAQIADMERFVAEAAAHAIRTHVLGLRTTSLSVAAVCAGFDLVESQIIGASLEGWPMDYYMLKPIDLYRRLRQESGKA
jgi:hypothetical protein